VAMIAERGNRNDMTYEISIANRGYNQSMILIDYFWIWSRGTPIKVAVYGATRCGSEKPLLNLILILIPRLPILVLPFDFHVYPFYHMNSFVLTAQ